MSAPPELAISFACEGEQLVGIVSPAAQPADLGVVIVVGGPQYRAGSHRQFVELARALAAAGFPVLRFDYRGMGDSEGALRNFEHASFDIGAAITAFQRVQPQVKRVALWGLCDGASASLLYLYDKRDPRVVGLALLNPWVRSETSLAKTHVKHYYAQRLRERDFWLKLVSGKVAFTALRSFGRNVGRAFGWPTGGPRPHANPFQERMAHAWIGFNGSALLMLSERDLTAREFSEYVAHDATWQRALRERQATKLTIEGADHTCSTPDARARVAQATSRWLHGCARSVG